MPATLQPVPVEDPDFPLGAYARLPELVERFTKNGRMWHREIIVSVAIEAKVRKAWKTDKADFLRSGWGWRKFNESWYLQQWLVKADGGYFLTDIGADHLERLTHPAPKQAELPASSYTPPPITLTALPVDLESKLFEYQIEPARQLFRAMRHGNEEWGYPGAVDCSDLGTGKTYQALAAALATGLSVGVVCPLAVKPAWLAAFKHFGHMPKWIHNYESIRNGNKPDVVTRNENATWSKAFEWQGERMVLIFDEAHNCKNATTWNAKMLMAAIRQRLRTAHIPASLRGLGITFITTGLIAMAFMTFSGI